MVTCALSASPKVTDDEGMAVLLDLPTQGVSSVLRGPRSVRGTLHACWPAACRHTPGLRRQPGRGPRGTAGPPARCLFLCPGLQLPQRGAAGARGRPRCHPKGWVGGPRPVGSVRGRQGLCHHTGPPAGCTGAQGGPSFPALGRGVSVHLRTGESACHPPFFPQLGSHWAPSTRPPVALSPRRGRRRLRVCR